MAEHSDAQASRVAVEISQQLEKGLEAVATSAAATSERQTRTAVEDMQNQIQAKIVQTRANQETQNAETQAAVGKIATDLEELTRQLNAFKPASVSGVEDAQKQYSEQLNARLTLQSERMDKISESVDKQQQTASENAELLQNLLVGIENLGDNLKSIHQEMDYWRNPEVQAAETDLQNLMNEAPEVAVVNPGSSNPVGASTSPEIQHQYPAQRPNIFPVAGLRNIPTSGVWTEDVEMTALRKPYPGVPPPVS